MDHEFEKGQKKMVDKHVVIRDPLVVTRIIEVVNVTPSNLTRQKI